jgi:hypothetical protein
MEDRASSCFRGVTDAGATLTKPTLLLMDAKVSRATILLTTLQRLSKERHHSHCKSRSSRWFSPRMFFNSSVSFCSRAYGGLRVGYFLGGAHVAVWVGPVGPVLTSACRPVRCHVLSFKGLGFHSYTAFPLHGTYRCDGNSVAARGS